jgi:K+-transporting ATPase ATPase C chain
VKNGMTEKQKDKWNLKPIIGITLVSLLICGILYPFFITGIGQVFFPYQANGDVAKINGQAVGSTLIAQNFTQPIFFQTRNETIDPSASSVDPDITPQMAYSQIPRISSATGISSAALTNLVNQNKQGTFWIFGSPYVDVLQLNLLLIQDYPSVYSNFTR